METSGELSPARIECNLAKCATYRAGETQAARRIQQEQHVFAGMHRTMHRPRPCPFANGQNLSCLNSGDCVINPQLDLNRWQRLLFCRRSFHTQHGSTEDHPGGMNHLLPLWSQHTRGQQLIGLLGRCCSTSQTHKCPQRPTSDTKTWLLLSEGKRTGRGPESRFRLTRANFKVCALYHWGFVTNSGSVARAFVPETSN